MKKLLAVLLTLCLLLPLAVFAEEEAEECAHENTYTYVEIDDPTEIKEIDNMYHEITGLVAEYTYCEDCGELIDVKIVSEEEETWTETHWYGEDGVCYRCGHVNTCEHKNLETYTWWPDRTQVRYAPVNDNMHRVTGKGYEYQWCADCGMWMGEEYKESASFEYHNFDGYVCRDCGYDRSPAAEEEAGEEEECTYTVVNKTGEKVVELYLIDNATEEKSENYAGEEGLAADGTVEIKGKNAEGYEKTLYFKTESGTEGTFKTLHFETVQIDLIAVDAESGATPIQFSMPAAE